MSECNHDCSSCSQNCEQRSLVITANKNSHIKKVIGIVSGKGGVGKSLTTTLLAVTMADKGKKVAIMDGDITGPSIPQAFGLKEKLYATDEAIIPARSGKGIKIVSTNLMLEDTSEPIIWRGPIVAGMLKQFFSETDWGDIDYMFVDLPPGTSDVVLTAFQSIPLDGIIVVSTPQQLVASIVQKAINMAKMMKIKVLGIVENMSYIKCQNCGNKVKLFDGDDKLVTDNDIELLAEIPVDYHMAKAIDEGLIENYPVDYLDNVCKMLEEI